MNKLLLGFTLGVLTLKISYSTYSYFWWTANNSKYCVEHDDKENPYKCIYDKMGGLSNLRYLNYNLGYQFETWGWESP